MREMSARLLKERTGSGVDAWNRRIQKERLGNEADLRTWLTKQGVTGYAQSLLVMERFGYPDFMVASADELVRGQYADRPTLRPLYDAIIEAATSLGEVTVQARKTYVSLVSRKRTFARVQASAKVRVDVALRLEGAKPGGRLKPSKIQDTMPVQVGLRSPNDLDSEVLNWLQEAYEENRGAGGASRFERGSSSRALRVGSSLARRKPLTVEGPERCVYGLSRIGQSSEEDGRGSSLRYRGRARSDRRPVGRPRGQSFPRWSRAVHRLASFGHELRRGREPRTRQAAPRPRRGCGRRRRSLEARDRSRHTSFHRVPASSRSPPPRRRYLACRQKGSFHRPRPHRFFPPLRSSVPVRVDSA